MVRPEVELPVDGEHDIPVCHKAIAGVGGRMWCWWWWERSKSKEKSFEIKSSNSQSYALKMDDYPSLKMVFHIIKEKILM